MAEYELITSRQNPKVLEAIALRDAKAVKEKGLFCFEGKKLFWEALSRHVPIERVFLREGTDPGFDWQSRLGASCRVYLVTNGVYEKISAEKSPEGIFCIAKTLDKYHKFATIYNKQAIFPEGARTLLAAVSIRDPGNLGSMIRSAAAFDCGGLILTNDCAGIYNAKTIRASMGTVFDFPILQVDDIAGSVKALTEDGRSVYAAALDRNATALPDLDRDERCCVLIGNEGHGLPQDLMDLCGKKLFIPMSKRAESLNASVAAAIILYSRSI